MEVRENDKKQILEAAKREADKAREPLEVYKKEKVKVKRSKRKTKTEQFLVGNIVISGGGFLVGYWNTCKFGCK